MSAFTRLRAAVAISLLLASGAAPVKAAGETVETRVREYLKPLIDHGDFAGVVVIEHGGVVLSEQAFGLADPEAQKLNTLENRFQVASISKQFTAAGVLALVEDQKVALDDSVAWHLPELGEWESVTVRSLLTHSSGLGDHTAAASFAELAESGAALGEVAKMIGSEMTFDKPGAYVYSNAGYVVLARLIEKTSGQAFDDYLRNRIFLPLEMRDTAVRTNWDLFEKQAVPLDPVGYEDQRAARQLHPTVNTGAAGVVTTAADLLRWMAALRAGSAGASNVLASSSWASLLEDAGHGYGLGISVSKTRVGHDGRTAGVSAAVDWYPDTDHVVVILANVQTGALDQVRGGVARLARGGEAQPIRLRGTSSSPRLRGSPRWLSKRLREGALGSYRFAPELVVHVTEQGGRLFAAANAGFATELVAMEDSVLFSRALYANIELGALDDRGQVSELLWLGGGSPWRGPRLTP